MAVAVGYRVMTMIRFPSFSNGNGRVGSGFYNEWMYVCSADFAWPPRLFMERQSALAWAFLHGVFREWGG